MLVTALHVCACVCVCAYEGFDGKGAAKLIGEEQALTFVVQTPPPLSSHRRTPGVCLYGAKSKQNIPNHS